MSNDATNESEKILE